MKRAPDAEPWRVLGIQDPGAIRFSLEQLVRLGLEILGADEGSLLVAEPEERRLRFAMVVSPSGRAHDLEGKTVPYGQGITGMAALTRDVQCASPAFPAPRYAVPGDDSPAGVLAAPILLGDDLLGVLTAVSFDPERQFGVAEMSRYGMLANLAASILDQQRRLETLAKPATGPASDAVAHPAAEERRSLELALDFIRSSPERAAAFPKLMAILRDL